MQNKLTTAFGSEGMWDMLEERADQIAQYGYTGEWQADNPQYYEEGQLIYASKILSEKMVSSEAVPPLNWDKKWWDRLCTKPHLERLAISGAMLASEIDRLKIVEKRKDGGINSNN